MPRFALGLLACILGSMTMLTAQPASKDATAIRRLPAAVGHGRAASVQAGGALVFTGQVFADDLRGDAAAQASGALRALGAALASQGGELARMVRLTAYVADDVAVSAVDALLATHFATTPVAFTLIRTPLARSGARVALEAVSTSSSAATKVEISSTAALLPVGGKMFISGQAEKGLDTASAVRLTMAGLVRSLKHLGLTTADVVQVKAFIQPFADHVEAAREAAATFAGGPVPPIVLMEWQSELFAEIELVVSARALPAPAGDTLAYSWLSWLPRSPRYSNACHVAAGTPLIFISAVDGGDKGDSRAQWKVAFERLGSVLFDAGSSYRHLAKATYYLGDAGARSVLGDIRGVYFDPMRPPAASALGVAGLGRPGRVIAMDMIAVPVK